MSVAERAAALAPAHREQLEARAAAGLAEYGQTLDNNPAPQPEREQHLREELLDALQYATWAERPDLAAGVAALLRALDAPPPTTLTLTLPWPPSLNRVYRTHNGRILLSREGRAYRMHAGVTLHRQQRPPEPLAGRIRLHIEARVPDKRRRDLDNALKIVLDQLTHNGVYTDDSQVDDLHIIRGPRTDGGLLIVTVEEL